MNTLALDLGTKTGWALRRDGVTTSGTWLLASAAERREDKEEGMDRRGDRRFFELQKRLAQTLRDGRLDLVIFEDVRFTTFTMQTQLWSALRCAVWAVFNPYLGVKVDCVDVPVLKKFGANHGAATKQMMAAWLIKKHPGLYRKPIKSSKTIFCETHDGRPVDDNEVDALHMLDYALFHALSHA